jgi:hypothetical protein
MMDKQLLVSFCRGQISGNCLSVSTTRQSFRGVRTVLSTGRNGDRFALAKTLRYECIGYYFLLLDSLSCQAVDALFAASLFEANI